jgi:DNA-binding response OmpR family regulator
VPKPNVLLVESDDENRVGIAEYLRQPKGFKVVVASDPIEVIERELLQKKIDLLITHAHFFGASGEKRNYERAAELCRVARKEVGDHLPIIALTGGGLTMAELRSRARFPEERFEMIDLHFDGVAKILDRAKAILGEVPVR